MMVKRDSLENILPKCLINKLPWKNITLARVQYFIWLSFSNRLYESSNIENRVCDPILFLDQLFNITLRSSTYYMAGFPARLYQSSNTERPLSDPILFLDQIFNITLAGVQLFYKEKKIVNRLFKRFWIFLFNFVI